MRRLMLLTSILMVFSAALSAQTVDELIAKSVAAKGGLDKMKATTSSRLTGNFAAGPMQAGFVEVTKRPNKLRRDITIQGLNLVMAYDGQNGWQIIPFTGKKDAEPMASDELKDIQEEADTDGPLVDYKQKGHKVELVGKEKVEGTDAYNLKVTLKNGDIRNIYLDADSFLPIKTTGKTSRRGTEIKVESTLGDYKEVSGILVPFSIQVHLEGADIDSQKITFEKVEFNVPVDDSVFKMPPPAPAAPADKKEPAKPDSGAKPPLN
jgi:outer membrane lipoprotein-sorting protein